MLKIDSLSGDYIYFTGPGPELVRLFAVATGRSPVSSSDTGRDLFTFRDGCGYLDAADGRITLHGRDAHGASVTLHIGGRDGMISVIRTAFDTPRASA